MQTVEKIDIQIGDVIKSEFKDSIELEVMAQSQIETSAGFYDVLVLKSTTSDFICTLGDMELKNMGYRHV